MLQHWATQSLLHSCKGTLAGRCATVTFRDSAFPALCGVNDRSRSDGCEIQPVPVFSTRRLMAFRVSGEPKRIRPAPSRELGARADLLKHMQPLTRSTADAGARMPAAGF